MDELIEELRIYANDGTDEIRFKAADAIEKLQQENDFLKGMQKQLVRGISNENLGQMVYRELRRGGHV